jgi:hypothetical protein
MCLGPGRELGILPPGPYVPVLRALASLFHVFTLAELGTFETRERDVSISSPRQTNDRRQVKMASHKEQTTMKKRPRWVVVVVGTRR